MTAFCHLMVLMTSARQEMAQEFSLQRILTMSKDRGCLRYKLQNINGAGGGGGDKVDL